MNPADRTFWNASVFNRANSKKSVGVCKFKAVDYTILEWF
jgi:hypothetical protein